MITALTAMFSLFTSGAGGGIVGGIFGIFKRSQERKERAELARIELARDKLDAAEAKAERDHALVMLREGAKVEIEKVQTESEAEIEIAHQSALSSAQDALKGLKTTSGMDNFRASVRPALAYWGAALFSAMIAWAFYSYHNTITEEEGKQILTGMFATLNFVLTSIVTFYYVSRRDDAPRG